MTRTMLAACAVGAFAASTTIGAQTPPAPKPQPSTPSMASQSDKDTVTLTGCLKAWDDNATGEPTSTTPSPTGTTPSATGAMAATKFMLTNVETAGAPKSTTPAQPSGMAAQHYVLMADKGVNLAAHLNHQVRITGKKAPGMSNTMHSDTAKPESRPDPSKPSAGIMTGDQAHKDLGTINVSAVTMISATCTGATQ